MFLLFDITSVFVSIFRLQFPCVSLSLSVGFFLYPLLLSLHFLFLLLFLDDCHVDRHIHIQLVVDSVKPKLCTVLYL